MIEMTDLPGEIAMTRCALVKEEIRYLFLVGCATSFAFQRLLVALSFFDGFTIGFVGWGINAIRFTILDHLTPGVYPWLLLVGFIIVFNEIHHCFDRIFRQLAQGVAIALIFSE